VGSSLLFYYVYSSLLFGPAAGRTIPLNRGCDWWRLLMRRAAASIHAVKLPGSDFPIKKIGIRFQRC